MIYWTSFRLKWAIKANKINKLRQDLDLPSWDNCHFEKIPQLCLFSEIVFSKPSDWNKHIKITGYCYDSSFFVIFF